MNSRAILILLVNMTTPFLIYALPRSRTAWLSYFLTYKDWHCSHDIVTDIHSIQELKDFFSQPYVGSAETGLVEGWELAERLMPQIRRVVIRRSLKDVKASLAKFGINADKDIERRSALLTQVTQRPGVLTVTFDDLNTEEGCKKVFEHCLQLPFDHEHWLALKDKNIQVDMEKWLEKLAKNRDGISALKLELARAA